MKPDLIWNEQFRLDVQYGFIGAEAAGTGKYLPRLVVNSGGRTVEHAILEELRRCSEFTFSVAFVSPGAIAQLKQHFLNFVGTGRIITSDFLGFNTPRAFAELKNLQEQCGIDVRIHEAAAFHPKGYIFGRSHGITAMIGSSNLTSSALSSNHEWNLKVSAAYGSDLEAQFSEVLAEQLENSRPLTQEWIDDYSASYLPPPNQHERLIRPGTESASNAPIDPNKMQQDALLSLDFARTEGARRAIIVSATGTGKTMLSALDVRAVNPSRMLFLVHREQILDRTISEFQKALNFLSSDFGKYTGTTKQMDRRFVFATVQSLSQPGVLEELPRDAFDYIIIDEAHRSAAETYQRIIDYFHPRFLLGMTATPERTDGFNVFEVFDYNVPYEIRLKQALESEMLCPFHYYGVTDYVTDDGGSLSDKTELRLLISPDRVHHLVSAIEKYAQAGIEPRGLIFCSSKDEARSLSLALNDAEFRGRPLRTAPLTGEDSIATRELAVMQLESGQLDYILTVDIFNEGIDIPSLNQVIMLRNTQSSIIFVQQLGRGLRRTSDKEYLVVIDFIGNYTNNFLIPIALFGDESLNRESLREKLNETIDAGALPGLSSVSFDEISRDRVLASVSRTRLDSMSNLKVALTAMRNRVGRTPSLWDFYRFNSVDPVLLATRKEHFPALVETLLQEEMPLSKEQNQALSLLSHEVLNGKRLHEFVLLDLLLERGEISYTEIESAFFSSGLYTDYSSVQSSIDTFSLNGFPQAAVTRYGNPLFQQEGETVRLSPRLLEIWESGSNFDEAVKDLRVTGKALIPARYREEIPFTSGMQYTRADAAHILGWSRSTASTIYGVKTDISLGVCAIFVTLHKSDEVAASTAYQDQLLDDNTMRWFSKSNRNRASRDVAPIIDGSVNIFVFVKKDDAEGGAHYFLGRASAHDAVDSTMPGQDGRPLPVVTMLLRFESPIAQGLFDYFSPE